MSMVGMNNASAPYALAANAPIATATVDLQITNISVDSILAYCTARMGNLDEMLKKKMQDQTDQNALAKQWSDLQALMQHCAAGGIIAGGDQSGNTAVANQLIAQYQSTNDPALKTEIQSIFNKFMPSKPGLDMSTLPKGGTVTANPDATIKPEDFASSVIDEVKTRASSISQGADLAMIDIQSLVSQRQQAMQLSSQMLAAVNEGEKSTIGNIRSCSCTPSITLARSTPSTRPVTGFSRTTGRAMRSMCFAPFFSPRRLTTAVG